MGNCVEEHSANQRTPAPSTKDDLDARPLKAYGTDDSRDGASPAFTKTYGQIRKRSSS